MYKGVKNQSNQQRVSSTGGMITPRGVKLAGQFTQPTTPLEQTPIKVYRPNHGQGMGPLGNMPNNYTLYDLITTDDPVMLDIRNNNFEDWVFPKIINTQNTLEDNIIKTMVPQQIIHRGMERATDGSDRVISVATTTQYLYLLLNPSKNLVQSFGEYPGMSINRSNYLVCLEVPNPSSGRLDDVFIQYALPLNTPIKSAAHVATTIPVDYGFMYLYAIVGNSDLERELFERWFNSDDYYFNRVIYPGIRSYMSES